MAEPAPSYVRQKRPRKPFAAAGYAKTCSHAGRTRQQFARILLVAESLGGPHILPDPEVQKLIAARARYGVSSPQNSVELRPTSESLEAGVHRNPGRLLDSYRNETARR